MTPEALVVVLTIMFSGSTLFAYALGRTVGRTEAQREYARARAVVRRSDRDAR
jgi:hypothetical protein